MAILKKIGVLSMAKLQALIMAIFGLIAGLFMAATSAVVAGGIMGGSMLAGMGFLAIIVAPIIYGILGFVIGAISAYMYNLVAGWIGGLELDLQ